MKLKKSLMCKKYEVDIWGEVSRKGKNNRYLENFTKFFAKRFVKKKIFTLKPEISEKSKIKRKKIFKRLLFMKKSLLMFYHNERNYHYKRRYNRLFSYFYKNRSELLLFEYESRLDVVLYRVGFALNIFNSSDLIRKGYIKVNKKIILNKNFLLKSGDIVEIIESEKENKFINFKRRLKNKNYLFSFPKHIEVFYDSMCLFFLAKPLKISYLFNIEKNFFLNRLNSKL